MVVTRPAALEIAGPAGLLEGRLELPESREPIATALVCHPHPLHGGTMDNKVAYTLARAFVELGAAALRFNFRGVGKSEGGFDDGVGETADALAAAASLRARWPNLPIALAGFSFGAAVALRAASSLDPLMLVTVAPPVGRLEPSQSLPGDHWLVIHGSRDALIDIDAVVSWLDSLPPGPSLAVIEDANHFFHGRLTELRAAVTEFAAPLLDTAAARGVAGSTIGGEHA